MEKRLRLFIIILTFGCLLIPTGSYACGSNDKKSCCKTETTSIPEKKDCCCKKPSKEKENGCGGKCGHSKCTTSLTINLSIISSLEIEWNKNFDFAKEKSKFYDFDTKLSSGFYSIWLPPVIG